MKPPWFWHAPEWAHNALYRLTGYVLTQHWDLEAGRVTRYSWWHKRGLPL